MNNKLLAIAFGMMVIASPFSTQAGCPGPGFGSGPGPGCPLHGQCPLDDWGTGPAGPRGGIDAHLARMTARLGLSLEQQAEIRGILEVQQATRQAMAKALHEAAREQVDSVLTPEQQARHARMMERHHPVWGGAGGPGHCPLGPGAATRWPPAVQ